MPSIHVYLYAGRTLDQKRKLVQSITDSTVKSLDVDPEVVKVTLFDVSKENTAKAGKLIIDID